MYTIIVANGEIPQQCVTSIKAINELSLKLTGKASDSK